MEEDQDSSLPDLQEILLGFSEKEVGKEFSMMEAETLALFLGDAGKE